MAKKLFVGNISFATTSEDLRDMFAPHGEVTDAVVIQDRATGRSRGFGFVEMASEEAANAAIEALNGANVGGRDLTVNVARERTR